MRSHTADGFARRSGWSVAAQTGAALTGAMGVGRFVFTPVLPLMEAQAHLTSAQASTLATSNYLGYLVGALLGISFPALSQARLALRVSGIGLVARWWRCRSLTMWRRGRLSVAWPGSPARSSSWWRVTRSSPS